MPTSPITMREDAILRLTVIEADLETAAKAMSNVHRRVADYREALEQYLSEREAD